MRRRGPEDDLEVLPVDRPVTVPLAEPATGSTPRRASRAPRRAVAAAVVGVAVVAAAAVATRPADDPQSDAGALVGAWDRADAVADAADRASVRVRVLVPIGDVDVTFRALSAVRTEERRRLTAVLARIDDIDARADDVERARDAVRGAVVVRERRARLVSRFYADGAEGVRDFAAIERGVAVTGREARGAVDDLRDRYDLTAERDRVELQSAVLPGALGRYGRVVDAPLGARLLLVVDGRLLLLDADAVGGEVATLPTDAVGLTRLAGGGVVAIRHDGVVVPVAPPGRPVGVGDPIGEGDPVPSTRPDAVWLSDADRTTLVDLGGDTLAGPFERPRDHFVVAAVSTGLVALQPRRDEPPAVGIWSPPDGGVRGLGGGWFVAAHGDVVVTSPCDPVTDCTLVVTDVRTGRPRPVAPPGEGDWRYEQGTISPDGRWLAVGATSTLFDGGLLFVDLDSGRSRLVRVASQATDVPHGLVWDDRNRVFGLDARNSAMWARPGDAELHPIRLPVAFDRPVRVDALAIAR